MDILIRCQNRITILQRANNPENDEVLERLIILERRLRLEKSNAWDDEIDKLLND